MYKHISWLTSLCIFFAACFIVQAMQIPELKCVDTCKVDDSTSHSNIKDTIAIPIKGKASYYGSEFNGRKTANGEIYDETAMTAAHRTLPFGTVLRVTNVRNRLSVIVRINDRGPFHPDRVLDLSKSAAEELDLIKFGVTEIEAEIVD